MSIFSWIFGKQYREELSENPGVSELVQLGDFVKELNTLLRSDKYIAKKDYTPLCIEYLELFHHFSTLRESKTLDYYCKNNHVDKKRTCS